MTQITEALEAARAHILDAYRIWQADDVSAVPPPTSGAGAVIAKIDAILSDGGQEVEAVVWSERENAFTDFWEQCPKLVDASDVGKARQAFMAGMDAASFFDGPATNAAIDAVANFLKERDEAVLPDEIDDDEREASARCILRVIGKASSQPASTALVERLTKALEEISDTRCVHDMGFDREIGPLGCSLGDKCVCVGLCTIASLALQEISK